MNKLPIIDLFVSIQGEGKYAGVPSIFLRTSGCNLKCVFANSICDTAYSSFDPEASRFTVEDVQELFRHNPQIHHLVITGGEPTLHKEALDDLLEKLDEYINNEDFTITVETNGTNYWRINPTYRKKYRVLYSISPKLATSVPHEGQTVVTPTGKSHTFTAAEVQHLNETRYQPEVLTKYARVTGALVRGVDSLDMLSSQYQIKDEVQFKFVYSGPASLREILKFYEMVQYYIGPDKIMLMPEGMTEEVLDKNRKEAVSACVRYGFHYTDRLHIIIFGNERNR